MTIDTPDGPVDFPDTMSLDDIQGVLRKKYPPTGKTSAELAGEQGLGVLKGVAKGLIQMPGVGSPSVAELDPSAKKWAAEPSSTVGESVGRFAGEMVPPSLPFMVGGPEAVAGKAIATRLAPYAGRAAKALGDVMGRGLVGGAAGAAQPTEGGLEERAKNAAAGAGSAAMLSPRIVGPIAGAAGGLGSIYGMERLIDQFGFWPVAMALGSVGGFGSALGHHYGLGGLARRAWPWASTAGKALTSHIPAGLVGTAAGRAAEEVQDAQQQ